MAVWSGGPVPEPEVGSDTSWLTNPIDAALASRSGSMAFRNQQELRNLKRLYGTETPIEEVIFVNAAEGSLNWYLTKRELEAMRSCFNQQ